MLLRQLPFANTCRNLYFNIKNYKSPRKRPTFRARNHPFCTNSQLLDQSYTNWLMKTSKTIPSKIFNHIAEKQERERRYRDREEDKYNCSISSSLYVNQSSNIQIASELTVDDHPSQNKSAIGKEIIKLMEEHNIKTVAERLRLYKEEDKVVEPEIINQLFEMAIENEPKREVLPNECEVELPRYQRNTGLYLDTSYYRFIYDKIPHLYDICQSYEKTMFNNKKFQENYIWLCYHMDNVNTLQQLVYVYLKQSDYDSKVISYIMSGFILNYEVEFSKTLLQNIISLGKPLDALVLDVVIHQFIKVDSLFENIVSVLESWIKSKNCIQPTPKTMATILGEYYKYGTEEEIGLIKSLISSLGYSNHTLIKQINLRYKIIQRDPSHFKKDVLKEDIVEFNEISRELNDNKQELKDFYYSFMIMFSKYSDLKMIKFVIYKMQQEGIELDEKFFSVICKYYATHEKFLQLLNFLKAISKNLEFNETYLRDLFDGFVNTYPHYADEFTNKFHLWIKESTSFKDCDKERYLSAMKIVKLESQYTPYGIHNNTLNSKKYESCDWSKISWTRNLRGKADPVTGQVNFRVTKGFRDILRKGVKPDYTVVESTFRRLNSENRRKLFELLDTIRLPATKQQKLSIIDLQVDTTKSRLFKYYTNGISHLNSNNRILLGRIFFNNGMHSQANTVLNGMRLEEMNDRSYMIKLNIQLRNYMACHQYANIIDTIQQFPIDDIVLSPYIYNQCCYIEKKLMQKLKIEELKEQQNDLQPHRQKTYSYVAINGELIENAPKLGMKLPPPRYTIVPALKTLRGLIGDIDARLTKDRTDIMNEIQQMFTFLNRWIADRDERKI